MIRRSVSEHNYANIHARHSIHNSRPPTPLASACRVNSTVTEIAIHLSISYSVICSFVYYSFMYYGPFNLVIYSHAALRRLQIYAYHGTSPSQRGRLARAETWEAVPLQHVIADHIPFGLLKVRIGHARSKIHHRMDSLRGKATNRGRVILGDCRKLQLVKFLSPPLFLV